MAILSLQDKIVKWFTENQISLFEGPLAEVVVDRIINNPIMVKEAIKKTLPYINIQIQLKFETMEHFKYDPEVFSSRLFLAIKEKFVDKQKKVKE